MRSQYHGWELRVAALFLLHVFGGVGIPVARAATLHPKLDTDLMRAREQLVRLLQGGPVEVSGSPVLCSVASGGAQNGQRNDAEWLFGLGACELTYDADPYALVTSATTGGAGTLLAESPTARLEAGRLLQELITASSPDGSPTLPRLVVHSTAWEIAHGLRKTIHHSPEYQDALAPLMCMALDLLGKTTFTGEGAEQVADPLSESFSAVGSDRILDSLNRILAREEGVLEFVPTGGLHAEQLLGRFAIRVFLTASNPSSRSKLAEIAAQGFDASRFSAMLEAVPDSRALLLGFINVLTPEYQIRATEVVAFYLEYEFKGLLNRAMEFDQLAPRYSFEVVKGRIGSLQTLPNNLIVYEQVPEGAMVRRKFVDAKPTRPGAMVTTLRANCLRCHTHLVQNFATRWPVVQRMTPPLSAGSDELLSSYYDEKVAAQLLAWTQECRNSVPTTDGVPP